jgi:hypothetical protein
MWQRWRGASEQWLASGGYLVLLMAGVQFESVQVWTVIAGLVALLALMAWQAALGRHRAMHDTPTSKIASAAQGFVELHGRGKALDGLPLLAPLTHLPCLWYRYKIERKRNNDWSTVEHGTSSASFLLDDGTGECVVDPESAEVTTQRTDTWTEGDHRYTQSLLLAQETIYVLGEFRSHSGADLAMNTRQDLAELLNEWKADMPALLKRYDRNGDGQIDLQEWEQVRQDAQQAVTEQHQSLRATPQSHHIGRPANGQPFLISSLPPEKLGRRFRWWAYAHSAVFLAALAGLGYGLRGWH